MVVWFDSYQARYMRGREWHPTQKMEEHDDGSLTLSFQTGAVDEVKRWVLGFGGHARVLAPPVLQDAVRESLREALHHYEM
jgi:predicted DNA-binding transcriptional regulator YafY